MFLNLVSYAFVLISQGFVCILDVWAAFRVYLNDNFVKTVNSRYALNSLKHSLNIISIMKISKQINSTISYRYAKKSLGEDYNVLDAKISYIRNKFNFNIQGSNLLDTNYYENLIIMPKSHVILSLSYNFN